MAEIKPTSGVDDRVKLADAIPLKTPFTLNIFPSNVCNFKCRYCAQALGRARLAREHGFMAETMSLQTLRLALDQARTFPDRFKLVSLMGHGEPLVHPHLAEMIALIKGSGLAERIDIITNGSLLTREKSRALIDAGLDVIRISLQGLSSAKYREISGVNLNYEEFLDNIAYFHENRGLCQVFVKILDVSLAPGEEDQFYRTFHPIADRMYIEKVKPVYDGITYSEKVTEVFTDRYGQTHEKRFACPQPFYMLSLWPNGEVAPCDAIYKANPLGNVNQTALADMWDCKSLWEFQLMQLDGKRFLHPACNKCCAPDDVAHPSDLLDLDATRITDRLQEDMPHTIIAGRPRVQEMQGKP